MHLLSSDKISFSMVIYHKYLEHSVVILADLFWSNLHLMIMEFRKFMKINHAETSLRISSISFVISFNNVGNFTRRKCVWVLLDKLNNHYKSNCDHIVILKLS